MSNYNKSFNYQNGLQVDDDHLVVNPNGLVGIGTSVPEKLLDVRGSASISGILTSFGVNVGAAISVGPNIIIDAASGIITATKFVGAASDLSGIIAISTDGFVAQAGSLSTTAKVGISTDNPVFELQVGGDPNTQIGFGVTGGNVLISGITTTQDLIVTGILTTKDLVTTGLSTFPTVSVTGFTTTNHFFVSGVSTFTDNINLDANLDVDGITELDGLNVTGISTLDAVTTDGLLDINSGGQANTFKIEDLTSGRVVLAGTDGEIEDSANLTFDGSTLTVTGGVTVSTNIDIDGQTQVDELNVAGVSTFNSSITIGSGATVGFGTSAFFPDGKGIIFGNDDDFSIMHDGNHSVIKDGGTGNLIFMSSLLTVNNPSNTENIARFGVTESSPTNTVELFHNNVKKFITVGSGVSVFNELQIASLDGGTSALSTSFASIRYGDESGGATNSTRRSLDFINYDSGNINYYLNAGGFNGSGNYNWHKGFGNELMILTGIGSLGIGINDPIALLHVEGTSRFTGSAVFTSSVEVESLTGNVTPTQVNVSGLSTFVGVVTAKNVFTDNLFSENHDVSGIATAGTGHVKGTLSVGGAPLNGQNFDVNDGAVFGGAVNRFFVNSTGEVGIKTTVIPTGISVNASDASVAAKAVGVGTVTLRSSVDLADAGTITTRFMIPPRVSSTERGNLSGVVAGAMIYNTTDNRLEYYNGSAWRQITDAAI